MPTYRVTDPSTGRSLKLTGDSPPNEQELLEIFGNGQQQNIEQPIKENGAVSFGEGFRHGLKNAGLGMLQTVLQGGEAIRQKTGMQSNQPNIARVQSMIEAERKSFSGKDSSISGGAGEIVGGVLPYIAMPGGAGAGLLGRLAVSGGQGAVMGALQPISSDEQRSSNALIGGVAGVAGQGVISAAGKGINAIAGKIPQNAIDQLSKKFGIRTTLGEATGNPHWQRAETWLERIPLIGLKGYREAQHAESEKAAKNFLSNYIVKNNSDDIMKGNRQYVSSLFNELTTKIEGIDEQKIAANETKKIASDLLNKYPDIFKKFQDTSRESIIRDIVTGTKPITKEASKLLDASGKPAIPARIEPKTLTFNEAWTLRHGLGEMISQAKKKVASGDVDKTTLSQLKQLYGAVNNDIDRWVNQIGRSDIKQTINIANDSYKKYVVKYDILQRAYDKASGLSSGKEMFSPKTFSTELKKIAYKDKEIGTFTASEIDELTGLANIMQVVKRSGQYMENPPTGDRWGVPMVGTGIGIISAKAAGAGGGMVALTRFLSGTEAGKALARAASKYEPNSKEMQAVVNKIYQVMPRVMASGATRNY